MDVKCSKKAKKATGSSRTRNRLRNCETGEKMAQRRISGDRLFITVVYLVAMCRAVPIGDLLDRASQRSDKMHSLSTLLTQEMDTHFPPYGRMQMQRPAECHTSALQTPNDKEQALQVSNSDLMSLVRSLLQAWVDPLVILSNSAITLPHPAKSSISSKIQELQEHSKSLADGLDILSGKMGPAAQATSSLPYTGGTDLGQDRVTILNKFGFLLSCLRRDSHKIDSFLKVLRCRAVKLQPELC
ncbi:Prolactin-1 [Characodon lateralis]|uniref:Prolactin-1 n=1 Tax=Characodon lateralis TaxID=208331 RepID=A0ABU7D8H0_9TELE|nr:Prolactin-1 [Characodon lateralis]